MAAVDLAHALANEGVLVLYTVPLIQDQVPVHVCVCSMYVCVFVFVCVMCVYVYVRECECVYVLVCVRTRASFSLINHKNHADKCLIFSAS